MGCSGVQLGGCLLEQGDRCSVAGGPGGVTRLIKQLEALKADQCNVLTDRELDPALCRHVPRRSS